VTVLSVAAFNDWLMENKWDLFICMFSSFCLGEV